MLRKIIGRNFGHVVLAEEAEFDINGLQVGRGKREGLDGDLVASEGELHPLTMGTIDTDRSRSYLASVIVPVDGMYESQSDVRRAFPVPYGDGEFVLDQDVLTVLEVVWVDYQSLCERVSFTDTLDDGESAGMGVALVENRKCSSSGVAYFSAPLDCGGA